MASCRAIVELQIPAATLHGLVSSDPDTLDAWGPVVTDLARQHTSAQRSPAADSTRRSTDTALRRHVEIRDRSCVMVGCRGSVLSARRSAAVSWLPGWAGVSPRCSPTMP
ncbi:MAG: hypothetical protein JO063_12595 [Pseudonocardiales bacterium]|nr:hypothetical protein [Pseudonocardiales bacterium]MBV9032780.1 hypothetical protein [Pseudonocardiales bacterium]MBW0010929.1 hypothetical protein [Pseudonocardiales bacterium]